MRSYNFYQIFVPSGVPIILLPFLVIIEVVSHIAKIFSLAIRLFSNMVSGHVLLHILTSFIFKLGKVNLFFSFIPLILLIVVFFLEYGITFLQAYVFVTLLAIYFEEHFGFTKEDTINASKLIRINGQQHSVVKHQHVYFLYIFKKTRQKAFFFFGIDVYQRNRSLLKKYAFWKLTLLGSVIYTHKGTEK